MNEINQPVESPVQQVTNSETAAQSTSLKNGLIKFLSISGGLVILLLLAGAFWLFSNKVLQKPPVPAEFTLKARTQDGSGITKDTTFVLQSTQALSGNDIQKIVKFTPPINFTVKQVASSSGFFQTAFAQDGSSGSYSYELKPANVLNEGVVYQASINDKAYAQHSYGWAFQVKSPFLVISTLPANKGTYVPTNTSIEVTFSRSNIKDLDKNFTISPWVGGIFDQHGDTMIFLPNEPLKPGTIYNVTINHGLGLADSNDTLSSDYNFAFETQGSPTQENYLSFSSDLTDVPQGIKPDLMVYANNSNLPMQAKVYKLNPDNFLQSYQKSRNWNWGWADYYRAQNSLSFDAAGSQPVLNFQPSVVTQNYQSYIEVPQILDPGSYIIDLSWAGGDAKAWFQVSYMAHYFSLSTDNGLFWLYNFKTKSPISGANLELVQEGIKTQGLGTSGADGLVQFNTPDELKPENLSKNPNPVFFKVTDQSGVVEYIKIEDQWGYASRSLAGDNNYSEFLSTDRYTYQMTDTLKFWGVAKSRKEDIRQKKLTVGLYDGSGIWRYGFDYSKVKPLVSADVTVSPFNTLEGSLSFSGLSPNTYSLVAKLGDEVVSQQDIEVLTYSKPSYELTVENSKDAIFSGDSVTFKVSGKFFDGTPLANATLNYNAYDQSDITGQVTLDNNGQGEVTLTPSYNDQYGNYYPRTFSVSFTPASSEEGDIEGDSSVLVFGPSIYLQGDQTAQSGGSYTFKAKLNSIDLAKYNSSEQSAGYNNEYIGQPLANYPVTAKITKVVYTPKETGSYYDPIYKTVQKTYDYVRSEQVFDTVSGQTDGNGEWSLARDLPKADGTYYEVNFSAIDSKGVSAQDTVYAYYADYGSWQNNSLSLSLGQNSYSNNFSVNDAVTLNAQSGGNWNLNNTPVLFYRYQNNISKAVVQNGTVFSEPFDASFSPGVSYRAVALSPYGFAESNTVTANFKASDKNLKITISSDKDSYHPGDKVSLKVHVSNKDNQPVSAETNIAVVDEAVFHVLPSTYQQTILDSLYKPIDVSPITDYTAYFMPGADGTGGAEGGGCFTAGTEITLASGKAKPIQDIKVGDEIQTFKSPTDHQKVPAVVQGISSHLVDSYLIINDSLKVTQEHKIYLNGDWNFAGNAKLGDILTLADGHHQVITSIITKADPQTLVYNIIVGNYHTYFAQNYYVHNAEKGGTSARDNFVDTAAFQTLQTNSSGDGSMDFISPDNITSWRVTARSFEPNGLLAGQQTKLIPTTLPFFINSIMTDTYLVGDSPQIKISLYGTGYKADQDAQVNLSSDSLSLNQNLTIKNHLGFVSLKPLPEGQYDLLITAKQGDLHDAVKRHITVVKSYFTKPTIVTQLIKNGANTLAGNSKGFTTIDFMDDGKGKFYEDLLNDSYSVTVRSDEVAGNYFANKLLNDNYGQKRPLGNLDLGAYSNSDGSIKLLTYSDSDLELTAKMADLAPQFVFSNVLPAYFQAALRDQKSDIHRQAIALYGLASLQQPVLVQLQQIKNLNDLTWQDKIYVALGLAKLGDLEEAQDLYNQAIRPQIHFDGQQAWLDGISDQTTLVKTTDLVGVLAEDVLQSSDSSSLWNYMDSHKPEKDLDILEKIMYIKSALAHLPNVQAKFSYQTKTGGDNIDLSDGQVHSITLSADDLNSLSFSNLVGLVKAVSYFEVSQDPSDLKQDSRISLTRDYYTDSHPAKSFKDGDVVKVVLTPKFSAAALDGSYQVVDYLPSGFKPITDQYTYGLDQGTDCSWYPDQIINNKLYFTISKNFVGYNGCGSSIQYFARVVNAGNFTANPAMLQSLTNFDDLNITATDQVTVK